MENLNSEKEKIQVVVIKREEGKHLLRVGNETIEISDFTTISSAHGDTELIVTIVGATFFTEISAIAGL